MDGFHFTGMLVSVFRNHGFHSAGFPVPSDRNIQRRHYRQPLFRKLFSFAISMILNYPYAAFYMLEHFVSTFIVQRCPRIMDDYL